MSEDAITSVCGPGASPQWPMPPPLSASTLDTALVCNDLEQQLRVIVTDHRRVSYYMGWGVLGGGGGVVLGFCVWLWLKHVTWIAILAE